MSLIAMPETTSKSGPASVSRRNFFRSSSLATTSALFGAIATAPARATTPTSTDPSTDIVFMSATKLAGLIRSGKVSAVEAVTAFYARIDATNEITRAVVKTCRVRALAEATKADAVLAAGQLHGPLHGVPFTIKDSIDTEGVITTGGTVGRMHFIPEKDATVVARLRAAGAILLGKTNTPEWTLGSGGIPGVNSTGNIVYGISRNPYDPTKSTSGSSGGAGANVAAGGAAFDLGTDWGGSIRGPAHNNGIAGIKPTYGRVPRTGHIVGYGGYLDSWQEIGPMTRRVEDLALLMPILSGPDFSDCAMAPVPWTDPATIDISKLRVAFFTSNGVKQPTAETVETVRRSADYFAQAGATMTEDCPTELIAELDAIRFEFMSGDGWSYLKRLAEKWGTKAVSPTIIARYDQAVVSTARLVELWEQQDANKSKWAQWMRSYDLIICPAASDPAEDINFGARQWSPGSSYFGMFNTTGYPSGVVRAGTSPDQLPIGVMLTAKPWHDHTVIAGLAHVESQTGGWQRPPV
jgi:amidase